LQRYCSGARRVVLSEISCGQNKCQRLNEAKNVQLAQRNAHIQSFMSVRLSFCSILWSSPPLVWRRRTMPGVLAVEPIGPSARVYVRLRPGDHALLRERAARRIATIYSK
jgi:hypothetical protein